MTWALPNDVSLLIIEPIFCINSIFYVYSWAAKAQKTKSRLVYGFEGY